jgi:hypothetical protein
MAMSNLSSPAGSKTSAMNEPVWSPRWRVWTDEMVPAPPWV